MDQADAQKTKPAGPRGISSHWLLVWLTAALCVSISASCAGMDVRLQWDSNPGTDLAGYKCYYRRPGETFSVYTTVLAPSTTCTLRNLSSARKYEFRATAYNTGGAESTYSNGVTVNFRTQQVRAKRLAGSIR